MSDSLPDRKGYQVNRRRMCWVALILMAITVAAVLIDPAAHQKGSPVSAIFYSLSGLVAVYFGATSYTQAKK